MKKSACAVLAVFLSLWAVGANAATQVLFESDAGDYIGQGQTQTFSNVQVSGSSSRVSFTFGSWTADFAAPRGMTLSTGSSFGGATRAAFSSPTQPGLSVSGEGRGCNTLTGWFEVREALFATSGQVARLAIDFKQNCEGGSAALYGAVRFNSDVPLGIPLLAAVAGRPQSAMARDVIVLDGGQSFSRGSPPGFAWTQQSGPRVELHGANTSLVDFVAPLVPPGGEDLVFRLTVSADGRTDSDTVRVRVGSKSDPQTSLYFQSEQGDYIGQGGTMQLTPADGDISLQTNNRGGASFSFRGNTFWNLDFGPESGRSFAVGAYENAQRFAFADSNRPGIDVTGDGRGCNTITGRFDVLQILRSSTGTISRLAVDYEQHCEGGSAALRGKVRWNYLEPGAPTAVAGADQTPASGSTVVLDGTGSFDDRGVVLYRWRQLQGTAVTLTGADTARASFVAPSGTATQLLQFQLMVADSGDLTAADTLDVTINPSPSTGGSGGTGSGGSTPTPTPTPGTPITDGSSLGSGSGGSGGGGSLPASTLLITVLAALRRRRSMSRA